jgi:hypothetical protein
MSLDINGRVRADGSIQVDGKWYSETVAQEAIRYAIKRGKLDILTPNPSSGNGAGTGRSLDPMRTVYEVDAPPPVPNVGQTFKYVGKPSLPRGEAGDSFNDLLTRVMNLEVDAKRNVDRLSTIDEWITRATDAFTHIINDLKKIRVNWTGQLFTDPREVGK